MTPLRARRRVGALLALCFVTTAQDCGTLYTVIHHYTLGGGADRIVSLPPLAEQGTYQLSAKEPTSTPCPGFTVYRLSQRNRERGYFSVRLNRGPAYSLDVAYGYLSAGIVGPFGGGKPRGDVERPVSASADVVAQLAMQGSGVAPTIPAETVVRLRGSKDLTIWCARTPDQVDSVARRSPSSHCTGSERRLRPPSKRLKLAGASPAAYARSVRQLPCAIRRFSFPTRTK